MFSVMAKPRPAMAAYMMPVGGPVELLPAPPQQPEQDHAFERLLHQRSAERGRDELAVALAELGLGDEQKAGGC
jgi:hypothetical protein